MDRNPALDGLRGLAALVVLAVHMQVPGFGGGNFGVDVFFVLSGFLITSLLKAEIADTGRIDFLRFYAGRALRLYPPFLALLLAYVLLGPYFAPELPLITNAVLAGLYVSDYSIAYWTMPVGLSNTWSLSVEEHYYLLWPACLLLLSRGRPWQRRAMLLLLFVIATAWRLYRTSNEPLPHVYFPFDSRLSGLFLGAFVALIAHLPMRESIAKALGAISLACLAAMVAEPFGLSSEALTLPMTIVELSTAGLILSLHNSTGLFWRMFAWWPLARTGTISYALYLWHAPLQFVLGPTEPYWGTWRFFALLGLSYAFATASWFLIERYTVGVRRRLRPAMKHAQRPVAALIIGP
jgi:peptidoglycan/LPS O-acetylase OafA/YrhL